MSGHGSGGWVNEPAGDNCETLSEQTTLNSPNRAVLSDVRKGDVLDVTMRRIGKAVVIEALHNGQVAGTITSSIIQRLAECVEKGHSYVAEVTDEVRGGVCRVFVHSK